MYAQTHNGKILVSTVVSCIVVQLTQEFIMIDLCTRTEPCSS